MKALLWILLVVTVAANVSTSFAFDGGKQVAISVCTGTVAIASAAGLFLMRNKRVKGS
ncbi:hypothetical protein OG887_31295 [Streptomyces sp. NBC_00053]|uniref:Integral membrane protein n=2 Tax=Streptomyces TaxID=1883 RepID=A0ABW2WSU1_9ACTN|nr:MULTISPECIES: hypothetical protein [unclassified Streptomyces]WSG53968.1 hypothetical protein OHA38_31570 [Streptomyces sp. NBC_01732]WSW04778.1 hypothetical protein OG298_10615 [Streptomyces sp. NBC_01005]WTC94282.1 hypothetical protein OH736_10615 [Streptomyces sp. NBC_01650]MCX4393130.1 hypothetical protein [Streptomyces sp. NBC_01767]MCX4895101.1 hypothetical protein [Streptomyces sp. NBC_00892]